MRADKSDPGQMIACGMMLLSASLSVSLIGLAVAALIYVLR